MTAAAYDIQLEQGEDWQPTWQLNYSNGAPLNLAGYSAHMQFRSTFYALSVLANFESSAGTLVMGGALGTIQPILTAAASAALNSGQIALPIILNGRPVFKLGTYDLKITDPSGLVHTLMGGNVWMAPQVTVGGS